MSAALSLAGLHQPTEEVSFAEIEEQHTELLPPRSALSMMKGIDIDVGPIGIDLLGGGIDISGASV